MTFARSPVMPNTTSTSAGCGRSSAWVRAELERGRTAVAIVRCLSSGGAASLREVWVAGAGGAPPGVDETPGRRGARRSHDPGDDRLDHPRESCANGSGAMLSWLPLASTLEAARSQMAFTLGFHIILASLGVAFPAMMLIANYRGLRHDDPAALLLARRWSHVVA